MTTLEKQGQIKTSAEHLHDSTSDLHSLKRQSWLARSVGAVAIGRNEGERLTRCLQSLVQKVGTVVYVDSGSTDDSVSLARSMGVHVVELDMSIPFTAARARNEGIAALKTVQPLAEFAQVVDGDCAVVDGWLDDAFDAMHKNSQLAIVSGRRRERFPKTSKYNLLCDMEWAGPTGLISYCGGDALIRLHAFNEVGGYDASLIAGEEPEMCVRLRQREWRILRLDRDITWHDASMTKFSQFWKRAIRSGHAYAEGYALHGKSTESFRRKEVRSIAFWAGVFPVAMIALAWPTFGASLIVLQAGLGRLARKIAKGREAFGDSKQDASLYGKYVVLGKFAQLQGMLQFKVRTLLRRKPKLIEYK
jgi:GT2 family glycosyltransferase